MKRTIIVATLLAAVACSSAAQRQQRQLLAANQGDRRCINIAFRMLAKSGETYGSGIWGALKSARCVHARRMRLFDASEL